MTLYKIYASQGQGECLVEVFGSLSEAEEYLNDHQGEASFAIRHSVCE